MILHATDYVALVELWSGIKNYVPVKDQRSCAEQFISNIDEAGLIDFSMANLELYGVCDVFDKSLRNYIEDNGYDNEIDEEADDWEE